MVGVLVLTCRVGRIGRHDERAQDWVGQRSEGGRGVGFDQNGQVSCNLDSEIESCVDNKEFRITRGSVMIKNVSLDDSSAKNRKKVM